MRENCNPASEQRGCNKCLELHPLSVMPNMEMDKVKVDVNEAECIDPEYPLEVSVQIEDWYSALFKLRIEGDDLSRRVTGIAEKVSYGVVGFEDDEDVPDNTIYAEKLAFDALVDYLRKKNPESDLNGTITRKHWILGYNDPREYKI